MNIKINVEKLSLVAPEYDAKIELNGVSYEATEMKAEEIREIRHIVEAITGNTSPETLTTSAEKVKEVVAGLRSWLEEKGILKKDYTIIP